MSVHPPPNSGTRNTQKQVIDINELYRYGLMEQYHRQAVSEATKIIAQTPEGVVDGVGISFRSWKRHPFKGSIVVAGMVILPIWVASLLGSAVVAAFIPHELPAHEGNASRAGNAVGRTVNYVFNGSRPGIAAAYAQHLQEKQARLGGYPTNAGGQLPAGNLPVLTTGNTRLVNAGSSSAAVPNAQGLDPATVQAIQNFAVGK